jgi:transposase
MYNYVMSRPRRIDEELVNKAQATLREAQTVEQLRMAQAVVLPALMNYTLEQTATVLGVGRATVSRLQRRFRIRQTVGDVPSRSWGGRRRALMSIEQERAFLAPWLEQAIRGEVLVVSPLRAALAQELGRPVSASVVYRLLERHGWHKVAPDTRHPKSDPQVQQEWKKNSRKCWQKS